MKQSDDGLRRFASRVLLVGRMDSLEAVERGNVRTVADWSASNDALARARIGELTDMVRKKAGSHGQRDKLVTQMDVLSALGLGHESGSRVIRRRGRTGLRVADGLASVPDFALHDLMADESKGHPKPCDDQALLRSLAGVSEDGRVAQDLMVDGSWSSPDLCTRHGFMARAAVKCRGQASRADVRAAAPRDPRPEATDANTIGATLSTGGVLWACPSS